VTKGSSSEELACSFTNNLNKSGPDCHPEPGTGEDARHDMEETERRPYAILTEVSSANEAEAISDSFAPATPVPVSESLRRSVLVLNR
jgi:hypothetical protein